MTESEFSMWLEAHIAAFPGIKPWGKRLGNWDAIRACWLKILRDVEFDDAIKVTDAWANGDKEPPKGFGDHVRRLRLTCKGVADQRATWATRKMIDGQPTYKCPDCQDSVYLDVFHPDAMGEALRGTLTRDWCREVDRSLTVRCDCEGAMKNENEYVPRIDRRCMVPLNRGSIDEAFNRLDAHMEKVRNARGLFANTEF